MQAQSADGIIHEFPDGTDPSVIDRAMKSYADQPSPLMDALKGLPRNLLAGILDAATTGAQAEAHGMSQPDLAAEIPNTEGALKTIEPVTGQLYAPQTATGQIIGSGARALTNPANYIGAGTIPLKMGAAALSGAGSEAGRQATGETGYEQLGGLAGGVMGGIAGVKTLGPKIPTAKIPTLPEVNAASDIGYANMRKSDVLMNPNKLADWALQQEQNLTNGDKYAFTGGQYGTAPKTLRILEQLKNPPESTASSFGRSAVEDALGLPRTSPRASYTTPANLDTLRRNLGYIAGETQLTTRGPTPTSDAKAAMVLKRGVDNLLENPPEGLVVAGDIGKLRSDAQQARGDFAAGARMGAVDYRANKGEIQSERNLTGSLGDKMRAQIGRMLENPKTLRGYSESAKNQIALINKGTPEENVLRQAGRLSNYTPLQVMLGVGTGGAYLPYQIAAGLGSSFAKHTADRITVRQIDKLAEILGKESPEYARRVRALPPADRISGKAALARALLNMH